MTYYASKVVLALTAFILPALAEEITMIVGYNPENREYTKIDNHTVNVGDTLNILVQPAESDNSLCRFSLPNADNNQRAEPEPNGGTQNLSPTDKNRPGWTYSWYGFNTAKDCGITIHSVAVADNGGWLVDYGSKTFQFYISAKGKPKEVIIDGVNITGPSNEALFHANRTDTEPTMVKCIVRGLSGTDAPSFHWELGDGSVLDSSLADTNASASNTPGAKDYINWFPYVPELSHDNQELRCVVSSDVYTCDDYMEEINVAAVNVTVAYNCW